mgnify:CR=1 FL=1
MAAKGARVHIYGDWDGSAVKKASKDLDGFGKEAKGLSNSVKGAFLGVGAAIGAAFSLDAVINFMKGAAQAAMEDERSMVALAKAMENVGLAAQNAGVEAFIEDLMLARGVADDQLRPAFQRIVTVTQDVAESQKALALALDISAGTGRDLDSVTQALARAYSGQTTALQRLGVGIDAATLKSKDMDLITAALADRFQGQSAAAAETYQGQLNRLNVAVGEATESIGYSLLNALDKTARLFGGPGGIQSSIERATIPLISFTDGIAELSDQLAELGVGSGSKASQTTKTFTAMGEAVDLVGTSYAFWDIPKSLANIVSQTRWLTDANYRAERRQAALQKVVEQSGVWMPQYVALLRQGTTATLNFAASYQRAAEQVDFNASAFYGVNPSAQRAMAEARANVSQIVEDYQKAATAVTNVGGATAATTDKQDKFNQKLKEKQDVLRAAIQGAKDYAVSVAETFTGALDLSSALDKAKESGKSIVDEFVAQAQRMRDFAENMQKLLAANLSKPAFDAILKAGVERGADIADALVKGNIAENVRRVNDVYLSVASMGDIVGQRASFNFERAGIITAQGFLESFILEFMPAGKKRKQLLDSIDSMVADALGSMSRLMNVPMPSGGGGGGAVDFTPVQQAVQQVADSIAPRPMGAYTPPIPSMGPVIPSGEGRIFAEMAALNRRRANGGPVSGGKTYLVGEEGPELFVSGMSGSIIPNNALGASTYITVNVNAGMGTNGAEVGRQIVDALKAYERRNGPVYATA